MKTKISAVISLLLITVLCMSACSGAKNEETTEATTAGTTAASSEETKCVLTVNSDKLVVKPGDTFTVTFGLEKLNYIACFDCYTEFTEGLIFKSAEEAPIENIISNCSQQEDGKIKYSGITATTVSTEGCNFMTASFTVPQNAESGKQYTVSAKMSQFLLGTDASGDETYDVYEQFNNGSVTVTVE